MLPSRIAFLKPGVYLESFTLWGIQDVDCFERMFHFLQLLCGRGEYILKRGVCFAVKRRVIENSLVVEYDEAKIPLSRRSIACTFLLEAG